MTKTRELNRVDLVLIKTEDTVVGLADVPQSDGSVISSRGELELIGRRPSQRVGLGLGKRTRGTREIM